MELFRNPARSCSKVAQISHVSLYVVQHFIICTLGLKPDLVSALCTSSTGMTGCLLMWFRRYFLADWSHYSKSMSVCSSVLGMSSSLDTVLVSPVTAW